MAPHAHGHAGSAAGADRRTLVVVLAIGVATLVVELVGAAVAGSLALAADAGHVLTDVVGIALALGAIRLGDRPATDGRTYGWYRAEVLAAFLNGVLLLGLVAFLVVEAWERIGSPAEVAAGPMLAVAALGALGNLV
jgi:cobalt-zinc-cadmium efflux system protein